MSKLRLYTLIAPFYNQVNISFARLEEGYENALKEYSKKQIQQLNNLIVISNWQYK